MKAKTKNWVLNKLNEWAMQKRYGKMIFTFQGGEIKHIEHRITEKPPNSSSTGTKKGNINNRITHTTRTPEATRAVIIKGPGHKEPEDAGNERNE